MQKVIDAEVGLGKEYMHCFTIGVKLDSAFEIKVDERSLKIKGKIDSNSEKILSKIGLSFRGLMQKILAIGPGDIVEQYETIISRIDDNHIFQYRTLVSSRFEEKVLSSEYRAAITLYLSEISGGENCAAIQIGNVFNSVVKKTALDFKKNYGGKTIPLNLTLDTASGEAIPFPRNIAVLNPGAPATKTLESVGAFRGYHLENRVAYFLEYKDRRGKCLCISFDEEEFFEKIRALSLRNFTRCTILYEEYISNDKVEYLRLKAITGQSDDLFEA